jgi:GH18 family chitinase
MRNKFASSAVTLVKDWGLDGIEIDWEYPKNANESSHLVLLLTACRDALDAYSNKSAKNYHFLLTVASPAGPQNYDIMDLEGMDPIIDSWHLMAYDHAGSWDSTQRYSLHYSLYYFLHYSHSAKEGPVTLMNASRRRKGMLDQPALGRRLLYGIA